MEYISIEKINVNAKSGTDYKDCIKECIDLSFNTKTTVNLFHNNSKFVINSKDILGTIYKSETLTGKME